MRINVIGLGSQQPAGLFQNILESGPVLARDADVAADWLEGQRVEVIDLAHVFDHENVGEIPSLFAAEFHRAAAEHHIATYLVPAAGNIGDESVRLLRQDHKLNVIPGVLSEIGLGCVQVIDALNLALAESRHPFDAGIATLDPRTPAVVTNFHGRGVVELARQRLVRMLGAPPPDDIAGTIILSGETEATESSAFEGLAQIVSILRSPDGCPWDREQTVESLLPQMIEELEEFREAWQSEGPMDQADELGDVLLHVVMMSQIARESGRFTMSDVLRSASAKMLRRHPHVFGDVEFESFEDLYRIWNEVKEREQAEKSNQE